MKLLILLLTLLIVGGCASNNKDLDMKIYQAIEIHGYFCSAVGNSLNDCVDEMREILSK